MPIRLCLADNCPHPATYRGRCPTHSRAREKQTHGNSRVYKTKRWRMLRRRVLFDSSLCPCGDLATDVHHVVAIEKGGDIWDMANLKALCHACHSKVTKAEMC